MQKLYTIRPCTCGSVIKIDYIAINGGTAKLHMSCTNERCREHFAVDVPFLLEEQNQGHT